ncbi:MAG: acylphosphatase [Campylobacterota bacterium]|nr:acylphosphatase [Campylobacterota bacterium]
MKSYKFIVSGTVQGVYYRKNVHQHAQQLNFSGYVKNLPDGTVEAAVSCDESHVNDFISMLRQGSRHSVVTDIKQSQTSELFDGPFKIRR